MSVQHKRSFYGLFVGVFFALGVVVDVVLIGSGLEIESIAPFQNFFREERPEAIVLTLFLGFAALTLLALAVYAHGLDPFRFKRPRILTYFNVLPVSGYVGGVIVVYSAAATSDLPTLPSVAVALAITLAGPLMILALEIFFARVCLAAGRACESRGWIGVAYFFFLNGLRCRPSVPETTRQCGLLLAELGHYEQSRDLLERLAPVDTCEDFEIVRTLHKAYAALDDKPAALAALKRQHALRPETRDIDRRLLDQMLIMEEWSNAIEVLESGRIEIDIDQLTLLHELYMKTGNLAQALARAREISELDQPPYTRSIRLYTELHDRSPDSIERLIDLGGVLMKAGDAEHQREGAKFLEEVLTRDPRRVNLRRQLAHYYGDHIEHERAEVHFKVLLHDGEFDPETYLKFADLLKAEEREDEALVVYQQMQDFCDLDWRGHAEEAALRLKRGELDAAENCVANAAGIADAADADAIEAIRRRIMRNRDEEKLKTISANLGRDGSDVEQRMDYIRRLIGLEHSERAIVECDSLMEQDPEVLNEIIAMLRELVPRIEHSYRLRDYLADLFFRQQRYDDMLEAFSEMADRTLEPSKVLEDGCLKILHYAPDHHPSRIVLAEVYRDNERWRDITEMLEPHLDDPENSTALQMKIMWIEAAWHEGQLSEARCLGEEILDECHEDLDFLVLLIRIFEDSGDYQRAFEIYMIAEENFPNDDTLVRMKNTVADNNKRTRIQELQSKAEKEGLNAEEHFEKAELHCEYEQTRKAIAHFQQAADDENLADLATARMAVCLCERRMFELAVETLESIELTKDRDSGRPELKSIFFQVADILESEEYHGAAHTLFKQIFHVDASFGNVVTRLEKLGDRGERNRTWGAPPRAAP